MNTHFRYGATSINLENDSTYGLARTVSQHGLNLYIPTADADEIMYELLEHKLEGSIYRILTKVDGLSNEYTQSISTIKYDKDTFIRFNRFADETTGITIYDKKDTHEFVWNKLVELVEEA